MQPTAESSSAAADGHPAGSGTRGLIGAIAGTAAVAAIATAVIVGSSYGTPEPADKDGAVATSTSSASLPKSARSAPASSVETTPSAGGYGGPPPTGGAYTDEDLENLPTIPPVVTDQIPALDPTIPALPASSETPQPSAEEVPPPPASSAKSAVPTMPSAPTPSAPTTVPPGEGVAPGTPTTASPSYPTPPGTEITAEVGALPNTARISFTITNAGDPAKAAAYQNPTLTIGAFPGLSTISAPAPPSTCTVSVGGLPLPGSTSKECAGTPLIAQLDDIAPGQTVQIVVDVVLSADVAGVVESIPLTFNTGTGTDQGGFSVVFTATPSAPFNGLGTAPASTGASIPTK